MALVSILGRQSYGCFLVLLSISCTDTSNDFNAVEQQCGFAPKGRHLVQVVDRDGKPVANAKVESLRGEKVTLSPKGCFEADEESEGYRAAAPGRSIANVLGADALERTGAVTLLVLDEQAPLSFNLDCSGEANRSRDVPTLGLRDLGADEGFGHVVQYTVHRFDSADQTVATGSIALPTPQGDLLARHRSDPWAEGMYQVQATHINLLGERRNLTQERPCLFAIDRTAPSMDSDLIQSIYPEGAQIVLRNSTQKTWFYRLNGHDWARYSKPLLLAKKGAYDLVLKIRDDLGNESHETHWQFQVVGIPDEVLAQPRLVVKPGAEFQVIPFAHSVQYCLKRQGSTGCREETTDWLHMTFPENRLELPQENGLYELSIIYRDRVGHEWPRVMKVVEVDGVAPIIDMTPPPVGPSSQGIELRVSELTDALRCRVVNRLTQEDHGDCDLLDGRVYLEEGTWRLEIEATDLAGNIGRKVVDGIVVDDTPPVISLFEPREAYPRGHALVLLSDGQDRLFYSLSRNEQARDCRCVEEVGGCQLLPYEGPIGLESAGKWSLQFCGIDAAGNASAVQSKLIRVDDAPPAITLTWLNQLAVEPFVMVDGLDDDFKVRVDLQDEGTSFEFLRERLECRVALVREIDGSFSQIRDERITLSTNNVPLSDWQECGDALNDGVITFQHELPAKEWGKGSFLFEARTVDQVGLESHGQVAARLHRVLEDVPTNRFDTYPLKNSVQLPSGLLTYGSKNDSAFPSYALLAQYSFRDESWEMLALGSMFSNQPRYFIGETSEAIFMSVSGGFLSPDRIAVYQKEPPEGERHVYTANHTPGGLVAPWVSGDQVLNLRFDRIMSLHPSSNTWMDERMLDSENLGLDAVVPDGDRLWASAGSRLYWTMLAEGEWQEVQCEDYGAITNIVPGNDGTIWLGTQQGVVLKGGISGFTVLPETLPQDSEKDDNPILNIIDDEMGRVFALRKDGSLFHSHYNQSRLLARKLFDAEKPFDSIHVIRKEVYVTSGRNHYRLEGALGLVKVPFEMRDMRLETSAVEFVQGEAFAIRAMEDSSRNELHRWQLGRWVSIGRLPFDMNPSFSCDEGHCVIKSGGLWRLSYIDQGWALVEIPVDFAIPVEMSVAMLPGGDISLWSEHSIVLLSEGGATFFGQPNSPFKNNESFISIDFQPASDPIRYQGKIHVGGVGGVWAYDEGSANFQKRPFDLDAGREATVLGVQGESLHFRYYGLFASEVSVFEWQPGFSEPIDHNQPDLKWLDYMMTTGQGVVFWSHRSGLISIYQDPHGEPVFMFPSSSSIEPQADSRGFPIWRQGESLLMVRGFRAP